MRSLFALLLVVGLAACETGPTAEEVRAMDIAACDAAGFETDSDAYRLCLLLQDTNRRLDGLSRRMNFLELDVRTRFNRSLGYCRDPC